MIKAYYKDSNGEVWESGYSNTSAGTVMGNNHTNNSDEITLSTYCKKWLGEIKLQVKRRTWAEYGEIVEKHILPTLGERALKEITVSELKEFVSKKINGGNIKSGKGLSSSSVNLIITVLKEIFKSAYEEEIIERNPADRIKRVRTVERKAEAFSRSEQNKIRKYIDESGDSRLIGILLAMGTGMRIGEVLALTWDDIDFKRGVINVSKTCYRIKNEDGIYEDVTDEPKTKSSARAIPVLPYLLTQLKALKSKKGGTYVVTNKKNEKMSIRSYQYIFKRIQEKLHIKTLNFHCLRHTFATRAAECGVDIKTVSELLGHKNVSITINRYTHSMWETKKKAVFKISKLMAISPTNNADTAHTAEYCV